jgi:hypothetical protein
MVVTDFWPDSYLGEVTCRVRPLTKSEVRSSGRTWAERTHACVEFLLVSARVEELTDALASDDNRRSEYYPKELTHLHLAVELHRFSDIVLFLTAIAYAGALNTELPRVYIGRRLITDTPLTIVGSDRSADSYDFLSSGLDPCVTLDQVLSWSRTCAGIWGGVAASRIEKAVSLLSHTFNSNETRSEVARLIWSTAGLEAIACDNSNSVSAQLKRRLPRLCDTMPFKNLPKLISDAYGFRSRLFHGDIPIMNAFNEDEVDYHSGRYDAEMARYTLALQMMLLAAIWKLIKADATQLTFEEDVLLI